MRSVTTPPPVAGAEYVLPPRWRERAVAWWIGSSLMVSGLSVAIHGRTLFIATLVIASGFCTIPGLALSALLARRCHPEHRLVWVTCLMGFRFFVFWGVSMVLVDMSEAAVGGGGSPAVWLAGREFVAVYTLAIGGFALWANRCPAARRPDGSVDWKIGDLITAGLAMVCIAPVGGGQGLLRHLAPLLPTLKVASFVMASLAGGCWLVATLRLMRIKAGTRSFWVDALDMVVCAVALAGPALIVVGPMVLADRADQWLLAPLLELALFVPMVVGTTMLAFARLPRGQRRIIGVILLVFLTSLVDMWAQIVQVLHHFTLLSAPFIAAACVNFGFMMIMPLSETGEAPRGLDRLSIGDQLRGWNFVPAVEVVAIGATIWAAAVLQHRHRWSVWIAVAVLASVIGLTVLRNLYTMTETRSLNRMLFQQSRTDPLTSLQNRRALFEELEAQLARNDRTQGPLCVAMIDIDRFKEVNDLHGHQAGDEVLRRLAGIIRSTIRPYDTAARYGGEEFCMVFPDTDVVEAGTIVDRIRMMSAIPSGEDAEFTFSAGIAQRLSGEEVDVLVQRADGALYEAKSAGRDRVVVA